MFSKAQLAVSHHGLRYRVERRCHASPLFTISHTGHSWQYAKTSFLRVGHQYGVRRIYCHVVVKLKCVPSCSWAPLIISSIMSPATHSCILPEILIRLSFSLSRTNGSLSYLILSCSCGVARADNNLLWVRYSMKNARQSLKGCTCTIKRLASGN